ncbi:putative ABC transporter [Aspergillus clavatus NRRL 1]|uniref:ABC transporter, putative n=1 Tax=Aspergillus clavatus (strain ATCC 1007 / CBS 513.65 / DSM 816 / NCTC 3887 / NRRL 1 / QM 1276 / 107) TaxID=344612 RepID=A1CTD3_ASPCL|nr:ABC transporter, putative [Aspergillus clavatus NRRL 1]EAW06570.1 ABC transporter, putative [Aspergillus clavatus NRRL 1]
MDSARAGERETAASSYLDGQSAQNTIADSAASIAPSSVKANGDSSSSENGKSSSLEKNDDSESHGEHLSGDYVNRVLSRRQTSHSSDGEDMAQIAILMSRMFGKERKSASNEEKTRHLGVVWKHLTVKGIGLGAALQPTNADILLAIPRFIKALLTRGRKGIGAGHQPLRTILDDFTGCVKPGEMLLVLGRPGSGCSTFLKVIGNQRAGYKDIEGDVRYGGADAETMADKYRSEVSYNPEDDLHYATLTVRDTLMFALKTRTPDKASRIEGESRKEYQKTFLSAISKLFWIEHALGTKVGNELIRGVSGGEKKRVSIGEAMVTKASTQCWDNSTKGLDASTALEYVQSLRSLTDMANVSTLVALYQASENLYNLFDKVMLIEEGKCAYYGSTRNAKPYFERLGFECPPRWTTPDFLTSVSDPHARRVKSGWEDRVPRSGEDFQRLFRRSDIYKASLQEIDQYENKLHQHKRECEAARKEMPKKNYTIPFYEQVLVLTHRQFLIMLGDKQTLVGKWAVLVFQALIIGSLFYNLPQTSGGVFTRGGVMFFILLFNALLAMAELTASFESRPIMLKHKSFSFYRPSAYALAQVVVDVPLVFIQVTLFELIVYFMSNLARTASQFFISFLFIFILTMTMYSFFRALGAICASLDVATRLTGVAIQALVVYTGYLIPPWKMHPWLKWLIWINPVQYAFEAVMANEFYNLDIQCVPPNIVPDGPNAQLGHQSCAIQGSTPDQTVVRGSNYIREAYTYRRSHLWRNFGIIIGWFIFFVALTMLGMELQKPNKGGSSVTIFKRGEAPKDVEDAIEQKELPEDVESGQKENAAKADPGKNESENNGTEVKDIAQSTSIFTWQDVTYTIPYKNGQRKLLQGVQGYVKPGRLTALMGASGAGKTTLLNTLAQRVNFGVVTGTFLVDGKPLPKSFQRATGFAEQMDIHEPTATVRESLRFSALLRQPKEVPIQEKYDYCEKIIDLLEMRPIAGATVGSGGAGLNPEQRKRLTIAVELASKPELLLFLDEPTSGLDSLAAFNIVRFLRRLADAGQAILCTIHQPSAVLFEEFDDLLLLKSGGRVVYSGELGRDSKHLIEYFESNGAKQCPTHANPAEYMLEVIGAGNPDYKGKDWGDVWAQSPQCKELSEEISHITSSRRNSENRQNKDDGREFAMPIWVQIVTVTKRAFVAYWRSPEYTLGKFLLHVFTGLFNTFTFWHLGNSFIDMQSRLFSIFMTLTISPPLIQQLQPKFLHFRNLYSSREANSKIYSWTAMVTSAILPELPYSIVAGSIYFNCWYWGIWFPRDSFSSGYTWMLLMLFELYYVGFGQFIAAFSPNELFASLLVPCFFTFVVAFCGVVVPYAALPHFWQAWMYWLTPFHYLIEGFLGVLTHKVPLRCVSREMASFSPPSGSTCQGYAGSFARQAGGYVQDAANGLCSYCQYSVGDAFAASFNVFYSNKWRAYGIFWAFVGFNFIAVYFFSWLYLHGVGDLKRMISARKTKKSVQ